MRYRQNAMQVVDRFCMIAISGLQTGYAEKLGICEQKTRKKLGIFGHNDKTWTISNSVCRSYNMNSTTNTQSGLEITSNRSNRSHLPTAETHKQQHKF